MTKVIWNNILADVQVNKKLTMKLHKKKYKNKNRKNNN